DQGVRSTIDYLRRHHALFTFGENVGTKEFPVPIHGLKWLPTRQPIVTDFWKAQSAPPASAVFASIANWSTSGLKDITWRGAKCQYVRLNTGWFSDGSACYLAAGRPVITQESGFTRLYGDRGGLFGFQKLSEVGEAVRQINADYRHHSRVARAIAKEIFEGEKVVASLLDRA